MPATGVHRNARKMFSGSRKILIVALLLCVPLAVLLVKALPMKAPSTSAWIQAPAGVASDTVVSCVENVVLALAGEDDRWNPRVTRKDIDAGILETGDFDEENRSGFRVKVVFDRNTRRMHVGLKGAGAYFVDMGVESAIGEFDSATRRCLSGATGPVAP
jgi:hypothetical protein